MLCNGQAGRPALGSQGRRRHSAAVGPASATAGSEKLLLPRYCPQQERKLVANIRRIRWSPRNAQRDVTGTKQGRRARAEKTKTKKKHLVLWATFGAAAFAQQPSAWCSRHCLVEEHAGLDAAGLALAPHVRPTAHAADAHVVEQQPGAAVGGPHKRRVVGTVVAHHGVQRVVRGTRRHALVKVGQVDLQAG